MRQWSVGRVDTEEMYPLGMLLRLREQEERQARRELTEASATHARALEALEQAEQEARRKDEALVSFQIEASGRRAEGYTIAQRREDAQEEAALLHEVRRVEARRDGCLGEVRRVSRLVEAHQARWEETRGQLDATQSHHERWRRRQARLAEEVEDEELQQSLQHGLSGGLQGLELDPEEV